MPHGLLSRCRKAWPPLFLFLPFVFFAGACSTSHTPIGFDPYFGFRQPSYTGSELLAELSTLELKSMLMPLEKKRLYDLYQAELAYLRPGTPRFASLTSVSSNLKSEAQEWEQAKVAIEQDLKSLRTKEEASSLAPKAFDSLDLRKTYSEILQLWNRENSEAAVKKIESTLEKSSFSGSDQNKLLQVRFRIALENAELAVAGKTFDRMVTNEKCGFETVNVGFLYSLVLLGESKGKEAKAIFDSLCEIDKSTAESIRRDYWRARMLKESDPAAANAIFEKIQSHPVPGYHTFFALLQLGRKYELPKFDSKNAKRPYLASDISVKNAIHADWKEAEERLKYNLRRDAQTFLTRASLRLRQSPGEDDVPALLYTAHLFHASGNHLEAMKLYSEVASVLANDGESAQTFITPVVLEDMFPRPFVGKTDWVSRLWQMDPDYVYAISRQESAFNPTAVSATDARGWMQLMPPLARSIAKAWGLEGRFSERYLFHVDENLKYGVFHLRQLQDMLGHPALIAAAYNAGASRAINWRRRYGAYPLDIFIELVPINETRNYIKLVLRNYFVYKALRLGSVDPKEVPYRFDPPTALP